MTIFIWILLFIIVLLIVITVHELGHFLAAKSLNIFVAEFAIGFGPKLFSIKGKETEYSFRLIPFGGYVVVASKEAEEYYERKFDPERMVGHLKLWQKIYFFLAGIIMNIIFALFLSVFFFTIKTTKITYPEFLAHSFTGIFHGIVSIFTNTKDLHSIAKTITLAANTDISSWGETFYTLLMLISINLALFNIIPIPPMDGYKALEAVVEKVSGKKIPLQIKMIMSILGILFILGISVYAIINDFI